MDVTVHDSGPTVITTVVHPEEVPAGGQCRVYWGSHGCHLNRGHPAAGPGNPGHQCDCCDCDPHTATSVDDNGCVGAYPYYGAHTAFYGDDATAAERQGRWAA